MSSESGSKNSSKFFLVLIILLVAALAVYFAFSGKDSSPKFSLSSKVRKIDPKSLARDGVRFMDLLSSIRQNPSGLVCPSESQCTPVDEDSYGAMAWRVKGRAALYALDPTPENKTALDKDFEILEAAEPVLPDVSPFSVYDAYVATKDIKFRSHAVLITSKKAAEMKPAEKVSSYGSMIDGMVTLGLLNGYKITREEDYKRSILALGDNDKAYEERTSNLLTQALRMKDMMKERQRPLGASSDADSASRMSISETGDRCWYSLVSATLFEITKKAEYAQEAAEGLASIRYDSNRLVRQNGPSPTVFAPCIDAAQRLEVLLREDEAKKGSGEAKVGGSEGGELPQSFIMKEIANLLLESAVVSCFDTPQRRLCNGGGAVISNWIGPDQSFDQADLCLRASYTVSDSAYGIFLLSRASGSVSIE